MVFCLPRIASNPPSSPGLKRPAETHILPVKDWCANDSQSYHVRLPYREVYQSYTLINTPDRSLHDCVSRVSSSSILRPKCLQSDVAFRSGLFVSPPSNERIERSRSFGVHCVPVLGLIVTKMNLPAVQALPTWRPPKVLKRERLGWRVV